MKDSKGHGSNGRGRKPLPGHDYHKKTNDQLRYIQRDAAEAGKNAQGMGDERGINKYADQVNDASTVLGYRDRTGAGPDNGDAAAALGQGHPKSGGVSSHPAFDSYWAGSATQSVANDVAAGRVKTIGRHGYNPEAVDKAIASSNRAGRRIGGKEAGAIHRLLRGRG